MVVVECPGSDRYYLVNLPHIPQHLGWRHIPPVVPSNLVADTPRPGEPQIVIPYWYENCGVAESMAAPRGDERPGSCRACRHPAQHLRWDREGARDWRGDAGPDLAMDAGSLDKTHGGGLFRHRISTTW